MNISNFTDLVSVAQKQPEPQRLLFLFAKTELTTNAASTGSHRGALAPVMCVDKLPSEIISFKALKDEADSITQDWDLIFVAGLAGNKNTAPSSRDAETHLENMTKELSMGQPMSKYAIFDRNETLIQMT